MFKDYDKYLSASLRVYLIVLISIFIMKIVGLDYFGLEINNPLIVKINNFCLKYNIQHVWYFIFLFIQLYLYTAIICDNKKVYFYALLETIILSVTQILLVTISKPNIVYFIISMIVLIITPIIINKKFTIKRQLKYIILITIYQFISLIIRKNTTDWNFVIDTILNIDQLLLLLITYEIKVGKGVKLCGQEVFLFSQKKMNLKNLRKRLHVNLNKFKKQDKETKLTIIIYSILSLFWNVFSVFVVLLFAKLNNTLIECIFILTSFWLSKRMFGKAFHLQSMLQCFIVSNLTYYVLNRITTPLGISIFVPILLGVGLSYVTSKLVKKIYKPLYRGMSKDLFEETILQVVDKDSDKYKICYDFYINKKSALNLSYKYNYSEAGIRKIKDRVNDKIKRLE